MADMFLALADIHGGTEALGRILEENSRVKGVFVAGDLTNFGKEKEAQEILSVFARISPGTGLFFVAGNCDTPGARRYFERQTGYIEQKCAAVAIGPTEAQTGEGMIQVLGCGGGLFHTGLTPFEVRDEDLESGLRRAYEHCPQEKQGGAIPSQARPLIMLTHTPPRDTFADMRQMRHLGSPAFASLLYEYEPLVWICGHIHEGRSVQWEGKTLVINPGPAAHGSYALMLIERKHQTFHVAAELRMV